MLSQIRPAVVSFIALSVISVIVYPAVVSGSARLAFPNQANGSVMIENGRAIGSSLIGQPFTDAKYFWPRPSATSPVPYNATAGSGSNLATSNPAQSDAVKVRIDALHAADPDNRLAVPADLVTASGSGLDPHISVAAAEYQLQRVAKARHLSADQVRRLVDEFTESRTFGLLGEPRVNVLKLNLALDRH